jgi:hypothetical protein
MRVTGELAALVLRDARFECIGMADIVTAVRTAEHIGVEAQTTCPSIRAFAVLSPYSGRTEGRGQVDRL